MKTIKIYNFEELSPEAKSIAIERLRDVNTNGFDWWEHIYEDAKNVGVTICGFNELTIEVEIEDMRHTAELIIANHGEKCETYIIATQFLKDEGKHLFRLNSEYHKMLIAELKHLTCDESVIETIKANDYHFNSSGRLMDEGDEMTEDDAKETLRKAGYYVGTLWNISDVKHKFDCTDDEAQEVLSGALSGEWIVGEIRECIGSAGESLELTERL